MLLVVSGGAGGVSLLLTYERFLGSALSLFEFVVSRDEDDKSTNKV